MKIMMDFDREKAEKLIAMAMGVPVSITKNMSDEELTQKAFDYATTYGFCDIRIVDESEVLL